MTLLHLTVVTTKNLLDILANAQLAQLLQVRQPFQKQDTLDQFVGVAHDNNGCLVRQLVQTLKTPVLTHASVQEVLVNGDQLVAQHYVQMLNNSWIALHNCLLMRAGKHVGMCLQTSTCIAMMISVTTIAESHPCRHRS